MTQDYYVYIHFKKSNGEPFYVGKGIKNRDTATKGRNTFWHSVVNKHDYIVSRVANNLTEEEALNFEKVLIGKLGRRNLGTGPLVNLTDGGDGISGHIQSEETRRKKSISLKGRIITPEARQKLREHNLGKRASDEARAKMSKANTGPNNSNADKTIYSFVHKSGETFTGTPWEMRVKISEELGRMPGKLTDIMSGRRKSTYGWSLS